VVYKVGANPTGLAVADVQGDGKLDVVTANETDGATSADEDVSLIYGSGTFDKSISPEGIFMDAILTPNVDVPGEVAVGDVKNDGLPDVVIVNPGANTVTVLLATGPGTFAPPATYSTLFNTGNGTVGNDPISIALGDLTGTGVL